MQKMLQALYEALQATKAKYVIIGGVAASIYGEARTTRDVDVVILTGSRNIEILLKSLLKSGFRFALEKTIRKLKSGSAVNIPFTKGLSVDLRMAQYGIDYSALETRQRILLFDLPFFICAPEELIVYKLARFSPLDEEDIQGLLRVQGSGLSTRQVKQIARELSEEIDDPAILERWRNIRRRFAGS